VTLVERHSRCTALIKLPGKDTAVVVAALTRHVRRLPTAPRRYLTWDRGLEIETFTVATNVKVYFCDPQSPRQRRVDENTSGLYDNTSRGEVAAARAAGESRTAFILSTISATRWRE